MKRSVMLTGKTLSGLEVVASSNDGAGEPAEAVAAADSAAAVAAAESAEAVRARRVVHVRLSVLNATTGRRPADAWLDVGRILNTNRATQRRCVAAESGPGTAPSGQQPAAGIKQECTGAAESGPGTAPSGQQPAADIGQECTSAVLPDLASPSPSHRHRRRRRRGQLSRCEAATGPPGQQVHVWQGQQRASGPLCSATCDAQLPAGTGVSAQLHHCPSAQLHQSPSAQLHQSPSAQLHQCPSAQLHQSPSAQLHQSPSAQPDWAVACPHPGCGRTLASVNKLTRHLLEHMPAAPPWRCSICGKEYGTKYTLRDHYRGYTGQAMFACHQCPAKFTLNSNRIMHVRHVHKKERRFECGLCGRRFQRRIYLHYHQMSHAGHKPVRCAECPAQMSYPHQLRAHQRTHTGERPHVCAVCSRAFNRADNLRSHLFTHGRRRRFQCRPCGAGFMRRAHVLQHITQSGHGHQPDDIVENQPLSEQMVLLVADHAVENTKIVPVGGEQVDGARVLVNVSSNEQSLPVTTLRRGVPVSADPGSRTHFISASQSQSASGATVENTVRDPGAEVRYITETVTTDDVQYVTSVTGDVISSDGVIGTDVQYVTSDGEQLDIIIGDGGADEGGDDEDAGDEGGDDEDADDEDADDEGRPALLADTVVHRDVVQLDHMLVTLQ